MVPVGEGKATVADTPVTASENRAPSVLRVNLTVEEPSASIAHARICGGPERAIVRSTRPITRLSARYRGFSDLRAVRAPYRYREYYQGWVYRTRRSALLRVDREHDALAQSS